MKNKVATISLIITLTLTIIGTTLNFGKILERIDVIIQRLNKIEQSFDKLYDHEKRLVILEQKVYNIEKGK